MKISLIAAVSDNGVIGRDGDLPWKLPDDMKFFMRTTMGHPIVMGRKTWDSFPGVLPKRRNIVITRQADFDAPGAEIAPSFDAAIALLTDCDDEVFIIGGGAIYELALPHADRLYITHVHCTLEGDARFPEFDQSQWRIVRSENHPADEKHAYPFTLTLYERAE